MKEINPSQSQVSLQEDETFLCKVLSKLYRLSRIKYLAQSKEI